MHPLQNHRKLDTYVCSFFMLVGNSQNISKLASELILSVLTFFSRKTSMVKYLYKGTLVFFYRDDDRYLDYKSFERVIIRKES
jgi:hypothetical protein